MVKEEVIDKIKIGLVALMLVLIFILVYWPHINYPYPLHADEWMHLNNVVSGNIIHKEMGSYLFLYPISLIFNLLKIYQFLPAIWACVSALALFWLMLYLTKNYWISLLSMLFFSTLKSNIHLMGMWFLVPFIFALPFCYLAIYFLGKGLESRKLKFFIFALISQIYVTLVHASIGALLFIILAIYLFSRFPELKKNKLGAALFLLVPILMLLAVTQLTGLVSLKQIIDYAGTSFNISWKFIMPFNIPKIYGFSAFIAALVGAFYAVKDKRQRVFVIWIIISFIPVVLFNLTGHSYIIRVQRAFYYLMIGLVPLSAIGLHNIISVIVKHRYTYKINRIISIIISIILILIVFINSFYNYYNLNSQLAISFVGDVELYQCYNPQLNQSLQYQLSHSRCFDSDYSYLEPLLNQKIIRFWGAGNSAEFSCSE